jgi:ADP-ribosylglycohydrolase
MIHDGIGKAEEFSPRARGMLLGAFVGDALALGAHWVYDTEEIKRNLGRVSGYSDPLTKYHPGKKAGDYTHIGDQMWLLLESLRKTRLRLDAQDFLKRWCQFWMNPKTVSYKDKATKQAIEELLAGKLSMPQSKTHGELAGVVRGMPILASGISLGIGQEEMATALIRQAAYSHRNITGLSCGEYLTALVCQLNKGKALNEAQTKASAKVIPEIKSFVKRAEAPDLNSLSTSAAVQALGQSCDVDDCISSSTLILTRHGHSFEEALIENVMAGGDSATRGIVIGSILGLVHGEEAIPLAWRQGLNRSPL